MEEQSTAPKPKKQSPNGKIRPKRRRKRGGLFNFLLLIGIIAAIGLFVWAEQQRRDAIGKLQETEQQLEEIRESTQRSGQAVADEVLGKLRAHIEIPDDPQPTVATIIDVDRLRETSDFYERADNGDHLVITENRAILYDPDSDLIIDVVPIQLTPPDEAATGEGAEGEGTPPEGTEGTPPAEGTDTGTPPAEGTEATPAPAAGTEGQPADTTAPAPGF